MQKIRLTHALNEMNLGSEGGQAKEFFVTYITESGKIKTIKCIKGTKYVGGQKIQNRTFESIRRSSVVMLYNLIEKRPETPKVYSLVKFNGQPICH